MFRKNKKLLNDIAFYESEFYENGGKHHLFQNFTQQPQNNPAGSTGGGVGNTGGAVSNFEDKVATAQEEILIIQELITAVANDDINAVTDKLKSRFTDFDPKWSAEKILEELREQRKTQQDIINQYTQAIGSHITGVATTGIQAAASKYGAALGAVGGQLQAEFQGWMKAQEPLIGDNDRFYQNRNNKDIDVSSYAAEDVVRQYLGRMGLAGGRTFRIDDDTYAAIKAETGGASVPQEFTIHNFTGLEVSSLAFRREKEEDSDVEKITSEFDLVYIPKSEQFGFPSAGTGNAEVLHESDRTDIDTYNVVERDGKFYFEETGEELTEEQLANGGIYSKISLQGSYETSREGSLRAVYYDYEKSKDLYFNDSLPTNHKGDFGVTFGFIKDPYVRRWVTNFVSPYLEQSGMLGMIIRAVTSAMNSGMLDGIFSRKDKAPEETPEESAELSAVEQQEFIENIAAISDPEKKQLVEVLQDLQVTAKEKEALAAAVGGDISKYDIEYTEIEQALSDAGKDPATINEIINALKGSDGIGNQAVDLELTDDPAKMNEYKKALSEVAEQLSTPSK